MISRKREREDNDLSSRQSGKGTLIKAGNENTIASELKEIESNNQHWERIKNENIKEVLASNKEFIFGNYDKFYYNRFLEALKDPRVSVFQTEWFKDKKCLDIGCNDGTVTIMIAVCYQPKLIEGIDIDYRLIMKAIKNTKYVTRNNLSREYLQSLIKSDSTNIGEMQVDSNEVILKDKLSTSITSASSTKSKEIMNKLQSMPKSFLLSLGYHNNKSQLDKNEKLSSFKNENNENFPNNIFFLQENYVSEIKQEEKYDTILCLNTVKWIHLSYGDIGVKLLFYNMYRQLKPGGLLILEPQCWKSYKKRKNLTQSIKQNFSEIKLKPEHFREYLESTYDLKYIITTNPPSNAKKSFDRPIYVFQKTKD